ncbi:hypothetical protein HY622_02965 [Candidatus Uhrbacteria bacterium]|nr:hypothetical protein [Candidatus Uhrbacteria bacterium]
MQNRITEAIYIYSKHLKGLQLEQWKQEDEMLRSPRGRELLKEEYLAQLSALRLAADHQTVHEWEGDSVEEKGDDLEYDEVPLPGPGHTLPDVIGDLCALLMRGLGR